MTTPVSINLAETDTDQIKSFEGRVVIFAAPDGRLDRAGRRTNSLTKGAVARVLIQRSRLWVLLGPHP